MWLALIAAAYAGTLTVDVLDVGQGDSILLRSPEGKAVLVDAGEGKSHVADQLAALGVTELSLAVATHPHADHIGGMKEVVERIPIKLYTDNGLPHTTATYTRLMTAVEAHQLPYKPAVAGQVWRLDDGITLTVLSPTADPHTGTRSDLNANSVVLRVTHGQDCMLLTGDAERETELSLLHAGLQPCEVLKVAHHGSEYATGQDLIQALRPKIAVISVGADNSYGHPGPETMGRLTAAGVRVYRTDQDQGVRLLSSGKGWTVQTGQRPLATAPAPAPVAPVTPPAAATTPRPPPAVVAPLPPPTSVPAAPKAVAPAATPEVDPACPYIGSSISTLFHDATCDTARRISPINRVCFASREAAEQVGRKAAQDCTP